MNDMNDRTEHTSVATTVKDPVCGMDVDPAESKYRSEHGGRTFYFCSAHCQARFDAD
ncbi:YHS domain-containing protein, partial [Salmonella enterica]|nr:YHS domain-containing protein [Salmonella enterica]